MANTILANREYLSEIDGAIGDGDHGINMAKGFNLCAENIKGKNLTLAEALDALSDALMEGIGDRWGHFMAAFLWEWPRVFVGAIKWMRRLLVRC